MTENNWIKCRPCELGWHSRYYRCYCKNKPVVEVTKAKANEKKVYERVVHPFWNKDDTIKN
jgi:hypothetical protein